MDSVNTTVVSALMHLRGIDEVTLANLVHVSKPDMHAWLHEEEAEERVEFETQLEILRFLGINGDAPRSDVVHYWRVHEPLFSRPARTYWALAVLLKAFGKAQAVYVAREADPAFTFQAKAHFGLRFEGFHAILEVTAHPLRSISFGPETLTDVSWLPDAMGVLLPEEEYLALEPGAMKVQGLTQYLTYSAEVRQWERLRDAALDKGIRASQVASLLATPGLEALTHQVPEPARAQVAAAPVSSAGEAPVAAQSSAFAPGETPVAPMPSVQPAAQAPSAMRQAPERTAGPAPVTQATPAPGATPKSVSAVSEMDLFIQPVQQMSATGGGLRKSVAQR